MDTYMLVIPSSSRLRVFGKFRVADVAHRPNRVINERVSHASPSMQIDVFGGIIPSLAMA